MQAVPAVQSIALQGSLVRMTLTPETIHARIKRLREEKGESQGELGSVVGVAWQSVQQWENGRASPSRDKIPVLAKHFGISVEEIVYGTTGTPETISRAALRPTIERLRAVLARLESLAGPEEAGRTRGARELNEQSKKRTRKAG
jgi:DNA-binding XRE family transcriptional regulator